MQLLKPYLPATDADKNKKPYCEGGAYFALGLIHANRGWTDGGKMVEFLLNKVRGTRNNTVLHGACLGLSTAAMATGGEAIQKALTNTLLQTDDAVAGEAAAYGLGLVNVGRGTAASAQIEQMLSYAHSTKHEKIIRGLSLGVALIMYVVFEIISLSMYFNHILLVPLIHVIRNSLEHMYTRKSQTSTQSNTGTVRRKSRMRWSSRCFETRIILFDMEVASQLQWRTAEHRTTMRSEDCFMLL